MYKIYQVEYNDTWDKIASKVGISAEELKKINGTNSEPMVGNLIVVPNNTNNSIFTKYIVKPNDSLYSIARAYNVSLDTLLLINGLNKDDYIYPNEEILVPRENVDVYVTKNGDTIETITTNFRTDINTLNKENNKIYLVEDQLIVHKKENY